MTAGQLPLAFADGWISNALHRAPMTAERVDWRCKVAEQQDGILPQRRQLRWIWAVGCCECEYRPIQRARRKR